MSSSSRASHSLSRRSAQPTLSRQRQRSLSLSRSGVTPLRLRADSEQSLDAEALALSPYLNRSRELSPGGGPNSTRKSRLETKLTARDQTEAKERERDQRKALLKEKRNTSQLLVQMRHAANEQQSKVKRGSNDIVKVEGELQRLEKWHQGQDERLRCLMQQLIVETQEMEEEFRVKHSEADEIRSTLTKEQLHLDFELRAKEDAVSRVEVRLQQVDTTLKHLDDGIGVTSHGGWRTESADSTVKCLLDDSGDISSVRGSRLGPSDPGPDLFTHSTNNTGLSIGGLRRAITDAKPNAERPVPVPIAPGRNSRGQDFSALPILLGEQQDGVTGPSNGGLDKLRHLSAQWQQSPPPTIAALPLQSVGYTDPRAAMSSGVSMKSLLDAGPSRGASPMMRDHSVATVPMSAPGSIRSSTTVPPQVWSNSYPAPVPRQMSLGDLSLQQRVPPMIPMPMIDFRGPPQKSLDVAGLADGASQMTTANFFNWPM